MEKSHRKVFSHTDTDNSNLPNKGIISMLHISAHAAERKLFIVIYLNLFMLTT